MVKKRFIAQCTPTLGQVHIRWHNAVQNVAWPINTGRLPINLIDEKGGEIAECRNMCVARALKFECDDKEVTHLFWIDDDVIVTPLALEALLRHDRDIASGVYFVKGGVLPQPLIFPSRGGGFAKFEPDTVQEMWGCGMGLTLVKTDVYKRMKAELDLPLDKYGNPQWYRTKAAIDDAGDGDKDFRFCGGTEDLHFCNEAARIGINPLVDCGKWAFGWHHDIKTGKAWPEDQWKQRAACKPIVWPTKNGDIVWE